MKKSTKVMLQEWDEFVARLARKRELKAHPYYALCNREPERWRAVCDRFLLAYMLLVLPWAVSELSGVPVVIAYLLLPVMLIVTVWGTMLAGALAGVGLDWVAALSAWLGAEDR